MVKVSENCIEMIKELPDVDPDELKQECLIKAKQKREPSAYSLHMGKCLRARKGEFKDRKKLFSACVDEYNEKKGG